MKRRDLIVLLPLVCVAGGRMAAAQPRPLTARDRTDIGRIERYLAGLHTLKGRFLQIAPDGGTSEGTAWLERPGRLRFEYDPPAPFLLVAAHGVVVFHDRKLQQTSQFPIGQTPLGMLLGETVALSGSVTVTGIDRQPGLLEVTIIRTGAPGDGSLTLVFADNPMQLRQWAVVDAQRMETRVSLFNVQLGERFDPKLFEFTGPGGGPGGGVGGGGGGLGR